MIHQGRVEIELNNILLRRKHTKQHAFTDQRARKRNAWGNKKRHEEHKSEISLLSFERQAIAADIFLHSLKPKQTKRQCASKARWSGKVGSKKDLAERDSAQQISKVEFRMSETKTYPAAPVILKMLQRNSTISEGRRVATTEKQPRILDLASLDWQYNYKKQCHLQFLALLESI